MVALGYLVRTGNAPVVVAAAAAAAA